MEINITRLLETDMFPLSHSRAEGGQDAGRETWQASKDHAATLKPQLLSTPEELQAMRDFARSSGGWDDEEVSAWTDNELNAIFLQWVAGDTRECPALIEGVTYEERDGEWYYSHEGAPDMETGPYESRSEAYQGAANEHYRPNCYPSADSLEEIDWAEYEAMSSAGRISGNRFRTDAGEIFFNLSN